MASQIDLYMMILGIMFVIVLTNIRITWTRRRIKRLESDYIVRLHIDLAKATNKEDAEALMREIRALPSRWVNP